MNSSNTEGILLVATGSKHREEAIKSVDYIKPHLNSRPITLVTDKPSDIPKGLFDTVKLHPNPKKTYRDKIEPLETLPYPRTIFLDCDLQLLQPIDDIFKLLFHIDLVGCHAPVRWCQWKDPNVPEGFCEINSGVIGLKKSRRQRLLIRKWLHFYDEIKVPFDQASLRSALWWSSRKHRLRLWVLPPEYNLRTPKPWLAGSGMAVKILHGRIIEDMKEPLIKYLNEDIDQFRSSSEFPTGQNQEVKKNIQFTNT